MLKRPIHLINEFQAAIFKSEFLGDLSVLVDANKMVWFRVPDLLKILGLNLPATRRIAEEDRMVVKEPGRRGAGTTYTSEPGMYMLVFASKTATAMDVKHWIAHEVLPSIRRNGGYIKNQELLPEEEKAALLEKIRELSAAVAEKTAALEKANAGKAKLQTLLMREEDRLFEKAARVSELSEQLRSYERRSAEMLERMGEIPFVEHFLESLRTMRAFEERKAEFDAEEHERQAMLKRIPYAKPVRHEADPLVRDSFGCVCRRSELLARDGAR